MFDPAIRKIEWAGGQGVIYWEDGHNVQFGTEAFDIYVAPLIEAFQQVQQGVEDKVIILESEKHKKHAAKAKQRATLLNEIRDIEEKMNRSTQAILAAQLSGTPPEAEDVRYFLYNYTKKLELRAQLATLDSEL